MVSVRNYVNEDKARIVGLLSSKSVLEAITDTVNIQDLNEIPTIYKSGLFLIAEDIDIGLVGTCALKEVDRGIGELKYFYIKPEFRRQLLGASMLRLQEMYAKERNFKQLKARLPHTMDGGRFLEKNGFAFSTHFDNLCYMKKLR